MLNPASHPTKIGVSRKTKISFCICFAYHVPTAWLLSCCSGWIYTEAETGHGCITFLLLTPLQKGRITLYSNGLAHFEQMQALFFASTGTRSRTSGEKVAVMHQHLSGGVPVALAISWAHWLDSPQMGHFEGSITLSIESLC
jgi:hypothetical protein